MGAESTDVYRPPAPQGAPGFVDASLSQHTTDRTRTVTRSEPAKECSKHARATHSREYHTLLVAQLHNIDAIALVAVESNTFDTDDGEKALVGFVLTVGPSCSLYHVSFCASY